MIKIQSVDTVMISRNYRSGTSTRKNLADLTVAELITIRDDDFTNTYDLRCWALTELDRRAQNSKLNSIRADLELLEEIIEALIASGKARHVAENLTNNESKMLAEGKRLGII